MRLQFEGERTRGIDLLERLLTTGERHDGELTEADARDAIAGLEQLELPFLVKGMIEGGEQFASQVHAEMGRGLQEVIQNAQDQGAHNIRFGWRTRDGRHELLIAHDGSPVALHDVVFMAYPLMSGSRADPDRIGRFGIGLKTLNQIADRIAVHCPPIRFEIRDGHVVQCPSVRAIANFWDPGKRETLFVLRLIEGLDVRFFREWFRNWDAESLLFLSRLRRLVFIDLRSRKKFVDHRLIEEKLDEVELDLAGGLAAERIALKDAKSGRQWTRYTVRYPTPRKLRELRGSDKPFGETVRLSIAVPQRATKEGRLYAGLPLEEPCGLAVSMSGPFYVNVDRTALRDDRNGVNKWLIDRLGETLAAVALHRFGERPSSGWRAVPLVDETLGEDGSWLERHSDAAFDKSRVRIRARLRLRIGGVDVRVQDIVYEDESFDGLLTEDEQEALRPGYHALPPRYKDGGRWRDALAALDCDLPIPLRQAMGLIESDAEHHSAEWPIRLAAAAVKEQSEHLLKETPWVRLTDGRRLAPEEISESGMLLVHRRDTKSLGGRLGVVQAISSVHLRSNPAAKATRQWLQEQDVLRSRASSADALRALARASGEAPVDISKDNRLLVQIRDAFEAMPTEERGEFGPGIGRNIALACREFDAKGGTHQVAMTPSVSYLPSAIDKNEGWPLAAGKTPGIYWVDRRYAELLKAEGRARMGALAFLRRLGCEVTPRLEETEPPSRHDAFLDKKTLPVQQQEELPARGSLQGFLDDWVSPDLDKVLASIVKEKTGGTRRRRARALFLAINRAWGDTYAESATADPVYWRYGSWHRYEGISATWIARLASTPWLTTQEVGLHPKPPREVRILTGRAFGLAGENPALYAEEIDEEFADSPFAEAIGLAGRLHAQDLLELLQELRAQELAGEPIDARRVQRCYESLARYCPGGADSDSSDATPGEIKVAFGRSTAPSGLVRGNGRWVPPAAARRGDSISEHVPAVHGAKELWDLLGVPEFSISDCVGILQALAASGEESRPTQLRVFRRIIDLVGGERRLREKLAGIPYYSAAGWLTGDRQVYATTNPALAATLSTKVPVWRPPLALEALQAVLPAMSVRLIDENAVEAEIENRALIAGESVRQDMPSALTHFKNALFLHHPDLFKKVADDAWRALETCRVALGTSWRLKVPLPGRRAVSVSPPAYVFREPVVFCALDEESMEDMQAGGQALASFLRLPDLTEQDRAFIAMAWERAFRQRADTDEALIETPEEEPDTDAESAPLPKRRRRIGKRPSRKSKGETDLATQEPPAERELIDPREVDLSKLPVTMFDTKRRGQVRPHVRRPLKDPPQGTRPTRKERSPGRPHIAKERETVGYELTEDYLAAYYDIHLEDCRSMTDIGADGVDRKQDLWVELKAHAGAAPDTVKLTPSEADRAREKKERYWLVIASGLEKGHKPELVIIPNPLTRLDTYIGSGIKLIVSSGTTKTSPQSK